MKILHIIPSYKPAYIYGGPIESVSRLCETLSNVGHDISVYTTTANGQLELDVERNCNSIVDGVSVIYFKRITKDPTHVSFDLWRHLFATCKDYDIIHIHSWWNILVIVSALICRIKGVKVIIAPRGMLSQYIIRNSHPKLKWIIHHLIGKWALKNAVLHATAESEFIECQSVIPNWKGFVLPNLLQLPSKQPSRSMNNVFTLIYLSRIHPKKGLEVLLEAISVLKVPVILKIAGSGDDAYMKVLRDKVVDLKIEDKVCWIGWLSRDDKFIELANSDLFILPSFNENFANTVVESLSVGTPVLITKHVGLASYVSDNKLGWVSDSTSDSLLNTIELAMEDIASRSFINVNGRDVVLSTFSPLMLAQQYIEKYSENISYQQENVFA